MPPYQEEYEPTMMIATPAPAAALTSSPSSHPNLLELPKDAAFLDLIHPHDQSTTTMTTGHSSGSASDTASHDGTSREDPADMLDRLEFTLNRARERAADIEARLTDDNRKTTTTDFQAAKSPLIFEACRSSLLEEMARKLKQAALLLEDARRVEPVNNDTTESDNATTTTTPGTKSKSLSSALIGTLQYLDTLESAMTYSSRERLEANLRAVANAIAGVNTEIENTVAPAVCVSSWRSPSLAFDFRVGSSAVQSVGSSSSSLPLDLEVKPIMEYTADELLQTHNNNSTDVPLQSPREAGFYAVSVKKCRHEEKKSVPREGVVGQAMVQVHIAPLAETKGKKKEAVWGLDTKDVIPMRIKEVRA